jgi:ubiquinone/menaquinone biosynthesis C-methylase UbiE
MHRQYWDEFYAGRARAAIGDDPSDFARWLPTAHDLPRRLIDVGTGTGRDGLWFARQGLDVLGLDFSPASVRLARDSAASAGLGARFEVLDLYDGAAVADRARALGDRLPVTVYGRFLVHAIEDDGRANLFSFARALGGEGGLLALEFRTGKDANAPHVFGDHYRHFLEPAVVVDELEALGAHVLSRDESHGFAVFRDEDPHVCRLVAEWR